MAPTEKVVKPASGDAKKVKSKSKRVRNPVLTSGVLKYSRGKVSHRKKFLRLKHLAAKKNKTLKKIEKPKVPITVVKKIGGAKNGGERVVLIKKPKAYYPTKARVAKRGPKGLFSRHARKTRRSLKPGRILILLAGRHAGKRVVLMKVMKSGLLLVNGPYFVNACPLRRISQRYVIGTKTRISLGTYKVPAHIDDKYFRRNKKSKRKARGEGDIFATKKERYVASEQRKKDQVVVDKAVKAAIGKTKEKKLLYKYLIAQFGFKSSQYPHRMRF